MTKMIKKKDSKFVISYNNDKQVISRCMNLPKRSGFINDFKETN